MNFGRTSEDLFPVDRTNEVQFYEIANLIKKII